MLRYFSALLFFLAAASPALPQTAQELFDDTVLHEIRLFMHGNDWERLKMNFLENTYYQADMEWKGHTVSNLGVRSRGGGSRNEFKPGLRLDFNRFVSGQTFAGQNSIILDNHAQDPTFMRERFTMKLFRMMGIAAPRNTFVRLFVNNRYAGLYSIVEEVDKRFLRANFGDDDGRLYEYVWLGEWFFEMPDLSEDPGFLVPDRFSPRTRENDPRTEFVFELVRTVNEAPAESFVEETSKFLDLEKLVRYAAVEGYLSEWDGLAGEAGMNNFYLYKFRDSDRFVFIPWDKDVTFMGPDQTVFFGLSNNVLLSRTLAVPSLMARFRADLLEITEKAGGVGGFLDQEMDQAYRMIRQSVYEDTAKPNDNAYFEEHIDYMRFFIHSRPEFVIGELSGVE